MAITTSVQIFGSANFAWCSDAGDCLTSAKKKQLLWYWKITHRSTRAEKTTTTNNNNEMLRQNDFDCRWFNVCKPTKRFGCELFIYLFGGPIVNGFWEHIISMPRNQTKVKFVDRAWKITGSIVRQNGLRTHLVQFSFGMQQRIHAICMCLWL